MDDSKSLFTRRFKFARCVKKKKKKIIKTVKTKHFLAHDPDIERVLRKTISFHLPDFLKTQSLAYIPKCGPSSDFFETFRDNRSQYTKH